MKTIRVPIALALTLFTLACVTINVYFPAEAAEKAADRIIQDVYGEKLQKSTEPQSWNHFQTCLLYTSPSPRDRS